MPYINIRVGTSLTLEQRQLIQSNVTSLMKTVLHKREDVTVVHIEETGPYLWSVGASSLGIADPIGAYVDIKVTEGTNTPEERAEMISETVKMLKLTLGALQQACYVVIDEIPSDSWGYDGRTQLERSTSIT